MSLNSIMPSLSDGIKELLSTLPNETLRQINEIRLRRKQPLIIVFGNSSLFITQKGKLLNHYSNLAYVVDDEEFDLIFRRLNNYSVHSVIDNLTRGFITADGGNRIGVTSTAVIKGREVASVKDISSLNIRIANEVRDCSRQILNMLYINAFPSIIVASPPAGGKTTFLRDFARLLSGGFNNRYRKVAIIDERNEIAYKGLNGINADIGFNSDVLTGFPKGLGIEMAIRTLSPEMIVCDEISGADEVSAIADGFLCGVKFAVSVHAASIADLVFKPVVRELLSFNEFDYIVLLNDYTNDFEIVEASEIRSEIFRNYSSEFMFGDGRSEHGS